MSTFLHRVLLASNGAYPRSGDSSEEHILRKTSEALQRGEQSLVYLNRRGTANGGPATVRALLYIVPGHERHHLNVVRERYLPVL